MEAKVAENFCLRSLIFNLSMARLSAPAEPVWLSTKFIPAALFIYRGSAWPAYFTITFGFYGRGGETSDNSLKSFQNPPLSVQTISLHHILRFSLNLVLSKFRTSEIAFFAGLFKLNFKLPHFTSNTSNSLNCI